MKNYNAFIIWFCVFVFVFVFLVVVLYNNTSNVNTNNNFTGTDQSTCMYNSQSNNPNTNIWFGLNSSGNYRGYGREYGGSNTPRYVYGYADQCN